MYLGKQPVKSTFESNNRALDLIFSDENQRQCSSIFPQVLCVIEDCKDVSVTISLTSLIGQTVANNCKFWFMLVFFYIFTRKFINIKKNILPSLCDMK